MWSFIIFISFPWGYVRPNISHILCHPVSLELSSGLQSSRAHLKGGLEMKWAGGKRKLEPRQGSDWAGEGITVLSEASTSLVVSYRSGLRIPFSAWMGCSFSRCCFMTLINNLKMLFILYFLWDAFRVCNMSSHSLDTFFFFFAKQNYKVEFAFSNHFSHTFKGSHFRNCCISASRFPPCHNLAGLSFAFSITS